MPNPLRKSKQIRVGNIPIGGGAPVVIQSMTNTDTRRAGDTLAQIRELASAGCEIVRVTVPDEAAVNALPEILAGSPVPVIADIHFDHRLALGSIRAGIHAIRLNPGNIGSADRVKAVAEAAGAAGIPIRVGANSGSLPKGLMQSKLAAGLGHDDALAESLVEAAMEQLKLLEQYSFTNLKVSLKASSVPVTVKAYRMFAERSDYPLHLGVTEAGTAFRGAIKSAVGIGSLLLDGIGDTIRVSLSAPPVEEIRAALAILEAAGLRCAAPELVSCPTCGRTTWDLISMANRVERFIAELKSSGRKIALKKVAVMGCAVNGPGEAADADIGIAGSDRAGELLVFKHGKPLKRLPEEQAFALLQQEILAAAEK
ncbi:MAG: flavodoxin-dependent (E)-4-hydroxy-3-methylbut-2-enyl-diphosphate synthase [Lentisphaeria bacterium]|nr:flavodoxin-dependent (E)-4-hydroxy-3-methylbut-2-enyl-diphosphate synthase [Lentisphaeria bacterium]